MVLFIYKNVHWTKRVPRKITTIKASLDPLSLAGTSPDSLQPPLAVSLQLSETETSSIHLPVY